MTTSAIPTEAISLPIFSTHINKINVSSSKKVIIAKVIEEMPENFDFTPNEVDILYNLGMELTNNSLNQQEIIAKISDLRGGSFVDIAAAITLILALISHLMHEQRAFQPISKTAPPHLAWLSDHNNSPNHSFGLGKSSGRRTITIRGLTQNSASDKKSPIDSYDYYEIMRTLSKNRKKHIVKIEINSKKYLIENSNQPSYAEDIQDKLATQIYDEIRSCDTNICDIAKNLNFKADNIKKIKDHVFYDKHYLDRYENVEFKRFDPCLQQALAWKRLEHGIHTKDDITWIKHEYTERAFKVKHGANYSESHQWAQSKYDGSPWAPFTID